MKVRQLMTKRIISLLSALLLVFAISPAAFAAGEEQPGYVLTAQSAGGTCTLTVSVKGCLAYSGRLAISFDPQQLTLQGEGRKAVVTQNRVSTTLDGVAEDELIDPAKGFVGFAWYGARIDAREQNVPIATLRFTQKTDALDSGSFSLRYVPDEGFGSWLSAASLQVSDGSPYPYISAYLKNGYSPLAVSFEYDGADRAAANGHAVTLRCRDLFGNPVAAEAEWSGRVAAADENGDIALTLREGTHRVRVRAEGYGDREEILTVTGDASVDLTFQTDEMLVEQAAGQLAIGFAAGDSANAVTRTVTLPYLTSGGVSVSWKSSRADVVTDSGLVYQPPEGKEDVEVTLTATLTHGKAVREKQFNLKVLSKRTSHVPGKSFTDLEGYAWAEEAILRLSAAGVIKGVSATRFDPSAPIKRGDFILLVMNLMAPTAKYQAEAFDDVPEDSYYSEAIKTARALDIVNGSGGNKFLPQTYITRQEMAVMVARAMRATRYDTLQNTPGDLTVFADQAQIASWATEDMALMVGNGHMKGDAGRIRPAANTSRAEAAVFIDRIRTKAQGQ